MLSQNIVGPDLIRAKASSCELATKAAQPRIKSGATLTVLMLASLPSPCSAQDAEIVITASGFEQSRDEVGQAITVIDADRLRTTQTEVVSDILNTVPGVRVARNGGVGGVSSAFVRGGDGSQTLVLIDGVRLNDPSSPNAAFDFGALLTGNIDRVEVLRGPNSVIWGSQAIGGVINIRTAVPTDALTVTARGEYGYRDTAQGSANVAGTSGILSGSIGGGYARTGGISALRAGSERDGYENYAANGKLRVAFTDDIDLDLRGYYNRGKVEFDDPFGAGLPGDTLPESRNKRFVAYVGLNARLADDRFINRLSYARTDITRDGSEPGPADTFNDNRLKGTIDRVEYHGNVRAAEFATLVFGAEYERSYASTFFPANGPGTIPDIAENEVVSGFAQAILRPVAGLTLTGGVRHDDFDLYGAQTTFGANFAYSPNSGATVVRGTYAEGFRAPTLTESTLPFGNRDLKPEESESFDVGIEHAALDGQVSLSATYFHRNADNLITFSFDSFRSENFAKARIEGVELELAAKPTDRLRLNASYSLVDAKSRSADGTFGNRLARRAEHSASLEADWTAPWGLSLGGTVTLVGDSFDDLANTTRLDGYALAGVRARYAIADGLELYGRVENLFDEQYEAVAGYGTLGRNAYVGVRVRY